MLVHEDAASKAADDGAGLIVGASFPRSRIGRIAGAASGGPSRSVFFSDMWGGFVAFRIDDRQQSIDVTRDPSGMAPCLVARQGGAIWLFSDLETAIAAGLSVPAMDWTALGRYLAFPHVPTQETCLAGVEKVLPGMRLRISRDGSMSQICAWSPWAYTRNDSRIRRYDDAVRLLRAEVLSSVGAWAARSSHIMLELSGGLDSSIIAACLRDLGASFSCVTFATDDPAGDERRQAGLVASALGARLHEVKLDAAGASLAPRSRQRTPAPQAISWRAMIDSGVRGAIDEAGADMLFSGGGGDNVFCYLTTAAPAADALRAFGPGPCFARAARDVATLHRASVWRAARYALRKVYWAKPKLWPRNIAFLMPGVAPASPPAHLWFTENTGAPPGKLEHTASIASAVSVSDGGERDLDVQVCYPLLSRPLIELCLGIPSWMWVSGGRNRAVARDAFSNLLPAETIARRTKGDLTGLIAGIYREHKSEIEALLMEGRLAREGILDREAVFACMRQAGPFPDASFTQLVTLAGVEYWIQSFGA
ncbi:asparagine synthase-related protein [Hyphococcus luteus]|uniref:asparagine synthase-related protein n=1 Tax=Hyphococcus luteus TaxID=2058213 RepID=UPI0013FD4A5F|nr:asparagine synthase-related protein [Marinicaulis flavus]